MKKLITVLLALSLVSLPVAAEITEQSEHSFVVKQQFISDKEPALIFAAFKQVQQWWEADHSFGGKAEMLYFDFAKERCFCEKLPDGGFVRHLEVIHMQPNKRVVFSGGLGPLQDQPVVGKLIWQFEVLEQGVEVSAEYRVYGQIIGGMGKWPGAVDFVLGAQVKRLQEQLK